MIKQPIIVKRIGVKQRNVILKYAKNIDLNVNLNDIDWNDLISKPKLKLLGISSLSYIIAQYVIKFSVKSGIREINFTSIAPLNSRSIDLLNKHDSSYYNDIKKFEDIPDEVFKDPLLFAEYWENPIERKRFDINEASLENEEQLAFDRTTARKMMNEQFGRFSRKQQKFVRKRINRNY